MDPRALAGDYDADYVARRWRVGWRHVEIGLEQVYTNVALSRLRTGLIRCLHEAWPGEPRALKETVRALNKLLDLDLAIIEDAYQAEYMARLQRSERLATLGQVAGGVAHELRNPLNVVKTSVYYLLNARNPTPEKQAEHLRRIERNVDAGRQRHHGAVELRQDARARLCARSRSSRWCARRSRSTRRAIGSRSRSMSRPVCLQALGDGDQLRIALGNLIRNARDAMPQGGRLVDLGLRRSTAQSRCRSPTPASGIEAKDLARIMEPLYSTKARGLGLGLAITPVDRGKESGEPPRGQRAGTRQHLHDPIDRLAPAMEHRS